MKNKSISLLISASLLLSGIFMGCEKEPSQTETFGAETETLTSTIPVETTLASLDKLVGELYGETKSTKKKYSVAKLDYASAAKSSDSGMITYSL